MRKFTLERIAISVFFAFMAVVFMADGHAQDQPASSWASPEQKTLSDKELESFVKAYVKTQKLREEYENSMEQVQEPIDKEKVQKQAAIKLDYILREQGLDVETYNRAFAAVNTNQELRRKALQLIEEERRRS